MSTSLEPKCDCIFCGRPFSKNEIKWFIDYRRVEKGINGQRPDEARGSKNLGAAPVSTGGIPLRDALENFMRPDEAGEEFIRSMGGVSNISGSDIGGRPIIVLPEDLDETDISKIFFTYIFDDETSNRLIFDPPMQDEKGCPYLCFSDDFAKLMKLGETERQFIESKCIRPVCPHCTSFLPVELLVNDSRSAVVRLGYIGPKSSGKTTLNVTNILLKRFERGDWNMLTQGQDATTHYLTENYYRKIMEDGTIPVGTPDSYVPPLLIRLGRKGAKARTSNLLLVLMDVSGELLQTLNNHGKNGEETQQDEAFRTWLEGVDGCLLMLDADREVLPHAKFAPEEEANALADVPPVKLEDLLQLCAGMKKFRDANKPAALMITKCDVLFGTHRYKGRPNEEFDEYWALFEDFGKVDRVLWQQPEESADEPCTYSADRHEALQMAFKSFMKRNFRSLWRSACYSFGRVDVFPVSNWGDIRLSNEELASRRVDPGRLEPFHTTTPIFWLIDVIEHKRMKAE